MLEHGNFIKDDIAEASVQNDLGNDNFDKAASLSGRFWSDPIADLVCALKQYQTRQELTALFETEKHSQPSILGMDRLEKDIERILNRLSTSEIIDSGLGRRLGKMLAREQGKAEIEESMRRLRQIDWRAYTRNKLEQKL